MSDDTKGDRPFEPAAAILVPVSTGELIDKLTILQIKSDRIGNRDQLANVRRELAALQRASAAIVCDSEVLAQCTADLRRVNEALWDVEDAIRACEAAGDFGQRFVALARSVYRHNDERARIKKVLNIASRSRYVEEKSYAVSLGRKEQ